MIATLLEKDARILLRNRTFLAALLAYPLLLAAVLGGAFDDPPARFTVGVVNEDQGGDGFRVANETLTSEALVNATHTTGDVIAYDGRQAALADLRAAELDAVVVIPEGFMANLSGLAGSTALELIVDEADPVRAAVSRAAVEGAMGDFLRSVVERKVEDVLVQLDQALEGRDVPIYGRVGLNASITYLEDVREEVSGDDRRKVDATLLFLRAARDTLQDAGDILRATATPVRVDAQGAVSEDPRLRDVVLPGALVLAAFWSGSLAAVGLWTAETEAGSLPRLAAAPVGLGRHVLAKAVLALLFVLVQTGLLLGIAALAWGTTAVNLGLTLLVLVLAGASAVTLGALAASLARGTGAASLLVVLVLLPMMLLGGLFYPIAYMPETAQRVAQALPMTHAVEALRDAMVRGSPVAEVAPALGALLGFAAAFSVLAAALAAARADGR